MSEFLRIPGEVKTWTLRRHRILGKGSFGCATLYEEVDVPGSLVVVKDVDMQTMKKEQEMKALETEVKILRRAREHPNIVRFLDYHHDGGFMIYIVMEYCAGGDLGRLQETLQYRASPPPEDFVASLLTQMLAGLNFLHVDQHTLHRDIKPQNIFLCSDNTVRIGDFGVSTILEHVGGMAKGVCGSPFYMAPELCEERAYDGKADIWSLGVTLYELMLLEKPFKAANSAALARQITRGEYTPIPVDGNYSPKLIELVHSFLNISTTTRPTLRRALRSSYVRSRLNSVPVNCLNSPYYKQLFGEELVGNAIRLCRNITPAPGGISSVAYSGGAVCNTVDNRGVSNKTNSTTSLLALENHISEVCQSGKAFFPSGDTVHDMLESEGMPGKHAHSPQRIPCIVDSVATVEVLRGSQGNPEKQHSEHEKDDDDDNGYGSYEADFDTDDSSN